MAPQALENFLRSSLEPLQYAVFFGVFFTFALFEALWPRDPAPPLRRKRWPTNILLTGLTIVAMSTTPVGLIAAADFARENRLGVLNVVALPGAVGFAIGFLGRAFLSWGTHLLSHKVRFLWAIHRVHHADTRLDVSSTVRFHPLEIVFTTPVTLAGVVAIGVPVLPLLIYELMDASVTVFSHSNVRLPRKADRWLGLFIVTPDLHRVHHSSHQPETDSNYGAVLTIWDRLLGTYRRKSAADLAEQQLGLREVRDGRSHALLWLLVMPFIALKKRTLALAGEEP